VFDTDRTIVAISSPAGTAPRGIVRLTGPEAIALADAMFTPLCQGGSLASTPGFRALDGRVTLRSPSASLPARAYLFRAPRSYTRQDLVELHLPGQPVALSALREELISLGAQSAGPGEFTARAWVNGRLDLSQAGAVADVIAAGDRTRLRCAAAVLAGSVRRLCDELRTGTLEALATVEATLDLPEEEAPEVNPTELAGELRDLAARAARAQRDAADLPDLAGAFSVVLAGAPNAGKSTLLNALSGLDRAIVSALAGTTRDVLRAPCDLGEGVGVELVDVAGLAAPGDAVERSAARAAEQALEAADAVLLVIDPAGTAEEAVDHVLERIADRCPDAPVEIVLTKRDLPSHARSAGRALELLAARELAVDDARAVSAVTGDGLDALRRVLRRRVGRSGPGDGDAMGLHDRQREDLREASGSIARAGALIAASGCVADVGELAAVELREALERIGLISGEVVSDDVLGSIFARFCVGK
jgi:tRNA modification GTPase